MSHFLHHYSPLPVGLILSKTWATLSRDYLPKKVASWRQMDCVRFSENFGEIAGKPIPFRTLIASKDVPFSASFMSSSQWNWFYPKFGQFLSAISYRKGVFLETNGLAITPLKFWRNHRQSFSVWRDPILNPHRGLGCPI